MEHYDVIIIGTGAGGGTLAYRLAPSGKRILLLERGAFLPREKQNWDVNLALTRLPRCSISTVRHTNWTICTSWTPASSLASPQ
jgi:choline dehydrogenase-like flavoprotein